MNQTKPLKDIEQWEQQHAVLLPEGTSPLLLLMFFPAHLIPRSRLQALSIRSRGRRKVTV